MKVYRIFLAAAVSLVCLVPVAGQSSSEGTTSRDSAGSRIFPLPILFYTPETGIAGGGAALFIYRDGSFSRPSSISADVIYTEKKQIILEISGDQYFAAGTYRLQSYISSQKYPNKFFGIGNFTSKEDEEGYTPQTFQIRASLTRGIYSHFNAGPMIRYESVTMKETEPNGLLATGALTGSRGGHSAAIGFVANWDTRDNTFAAREGSFYQLTGLFYRPALGSDYTYSDFQCDLRSFYQVLPGHVVAVQAGADFISGTPPFQNLAKFGGQNLMRGYYDGRFRDKNGIALQAEYRLPVWWRFGLVGFGGIAQVADKVGHLALNRFWAAGGLGLRFAWNPDERVNLRLDYGFGTNSSGMYITVTEAF